MREGGRVVCDEGVTYCTLCWCVVLQAATATTATGVY